MGLKQLRHSPPPYTKPTKQELREREEDEFIWSISNHEHKVVNWTHILGWALIGALAGGIIGFMIWYSESISTTTTTT